MHNTLLVFARVILGLSIKESQINIYHLDSCLNQTTALWIDYQEDSNINSIMSHTLHIQFRKCLISYIYGRVLLDFGKYGMSLFLRLLKSKAATLESMP